MISFCFLPLCWNITDSQINNENQRLNSTIEIPMQQTNISETEVLEIVPLQLPITQSTDFLIKTAKSLVILKNNTINEFVLNETFSLSVHNNIATLFLRSSLQVLDLDSMQFSNSTLQTPSFYKRAFTHGFLVNDLLHFENISFCYKLNQKDQLITLKKVKCERAEKYHVISDLIFMHNETYQLVNNQLIKIKHEQVSAQNCDRVQQQLQSTKQEAEKLRNEHSDLNAYTDEIKAQLLQKQEELSKLIIKNKREVDQITQQRSESLKQLKQNTEELQNCKENLKNGDTEINPIKEQSKQFIKLLVNAEFAVFAGTSLLLVLVTIGIIIVK
ncbi:Hypothetical_protein [Hexamita inflata]|uniref:Hypothetical_protein n=1 Tax=Hexamita inflata TaxID=28002 RepID=A0AA86UJV4_9EUKA|nr:Hypothetical protein HINF_LOCUS41896 [Hexamita inflata]